MRRLTVLVAAALLIGGAAGVTSLPTKTAAQTQANVSINATTTAKQPAPGEWFTVFTTIENAENSDPYTVDYVRITGKGGDEYVKAYVGNPGTISEGSSMTVPLSVSLDATGNQLLRVEVSGESPTGNERELRYPLSVTIREGEPQVDLNGAEMTVGARTPVNVTVSNGEPAAIRNLELRLKGEQFDTDGTRRINATLAGGSQRTFTVSPRPTEVGAHNLTAVFRFTTPSGSSRVVKETEVVDVSPLRDDVALSGRIVERNGSLSLPIRVKNFGNAPITSVVVSARTNETVLGRESAGSIPPDGSRRVRIPLDESGQTNADLTASYEIGEQQRRTSTTVTYESVPGALNLTGISFERENGTYRITGSASNVGLTDVDAAIVRVGSASGVRPSGPSEEYFIGTVEASNFVTFRVTTEIDPGVSRIPLQVSYLADGERVRRTVVVDRDVQAGASRTDSADSGGGSNDVVVPAIVTLVVLVILGVGAVWGVKQYDDGD